LFHGKRLGSQGGGGPKDASVRWSSRNDEEIAENHGKPADEPEGQRNDADPEPDVWTEMHEAEDERKNGGHGDRGNAPLAREIFRDEIGDDEESDAKGETLEEVPEVVRIRIRKVGDAKRESRKLQGSPRGLGSLRVIR